MPRYKGRGIPSLGRSEIFAQGIGVDTLKGVRVGGGADGLSPGPLTYWEGSSQECFPCASPLWLSGCGELCFGLAQWEECVIVSEAAKARGRGGEQAADTCWAWGPGRVKAWRSCPKLQPHRFLFLDLRRPFSLSTSLQCGQGGLGWSRSKHGRRTAPARPALQLLRTLHLLQPGPCLQNRVFPGGGKTGFLSDKDRSPGIL